MKNSVESTPSTKPAPLKSVKELAESCPTCASGIDPTVAVAEFRDILNH